MTPARTTARLARRGLLLCCAAWLSALLSACAGLPPRGPVPASQALSPTEAAATPLGQVAAASVPPGAAGPSGFRLLPSGEHSFDARTALAESAQRSLDAQYYHLHDDGAGVAFLNSLHEAAQRGVRVRLLVDDFHVGPVFNLLIALNSEPNAEVRTFNPLRHRMGTPLARLLLSWSEFDRAHRRMHNKLFVADNAVAIYGGRNVADEYFMRSGEANFIDLDVMSVGPVVTALSDTFDAYWNSELAWPVDQVPGAGSRHQYEQRLFEQRRAALPPLLDQLDPDYLGQSAVRPQLQAGRLTLHWGTAVVRADPPDKVLQAVTPNRPSPAMRAKLDVIEQAQDEVVIVNPYFVPGDVGMAMMAEASRRRLRGLIFTNSLASTDEPLAHRAYSLYRQRMLALGMQLYELNPGQLQRSGDYGNFGQSRARLHAKVAAIDRRWLLVGSVNLDGRSAILNTEIAINIDCPPLVANAFTVLGGAPWRTMYRVTLADDGQALRWRELDATGREQHIADEPQDSAWLRALHWFQSLFVTEDLL